MSSIKKLIFEEIKNFVTEIQSPLDPNYQISNIPPGYDGGILNEKVGNKNQAILNRTSEKFWIGSVNVLDGEIEEVHTYEEAKSYDFHHSFYFSQAQQEKMEEGECHVFWVEDGEIESEWTQGPVTRNIENKIKEQITII
jgi:hypothetical protein